MLQLRLRHRLRNLSCLCPLDFWPVPASSLQSPVSSLRLQSPSPVSCFLRPAQAANQQPPYHHHHHHPIPCYLTSILAAPPRPLFNKRSLSPASALDRAPQPDPKRPKPPPACPTMDIDLDPQTYIQQTSAQAPDELKPHLESFLDLYQRKLWYQLTTAIQDFLLLPSSFPLQVSLYNHFIRDFENKINSLKLVEIAVTVAQRFTDANEALEFLSTLATKLKPAPRTDDEPATLTRPRGGGSGVAAGALPTNAEAYVLARMSAAHFCLLLGKTKETEAAMNECRALLDTLDSVDSSVRAGFYRVSGDYYKWEAAYASYYKTSLLYLACLPNLADHLDQASQVQRAHDLGLAALLGDSIYNFGELLQHPILESLGGTSFEWIRQLLFAFNDGNLGVFESLTPKFPAEPVLQNSYPFLRQKICLMALIDAVFRRPVTDRIMPFETIASETKLPLNEVEHLVMKALSLGLVRGSLDQVDGTATITWVQPRVLSRTQIEGLKEKLDEWTGRVSKVGLFAHANGGNEILVQ